MTEKMELNELDSILDECGVELMLYESCQDAGWIQIFSNHPGWERISEDRDTVLFRRIYASIAEK